MLYCDGRRKLRADSPRLKRCAEKPIFGAFNQGNVPTIARFNTATVALGVDLDKLIAAMQPFVDQDVAPVEALSYPVNGIPMTDFVYPSYFENFHNPGSVRFDRLMKVDRPFQILPGGY